MMNKKAVFSREKPVCFPQHLLRKKAIAGIELVMMIVATFAIAFLIAAETETKIVSAATTSNSPSVCCEKTASGAFCINTDKAKCDKSTDPKTGRVYQDSPTSCESTSFCRLGTCYDSNEGICMDNTPQRVCQANGGTWDPRASSEIPQCKLGCCVIADQAAFVPLVRCKKLSTLFGVPNNYKTDITSEIDCIAEAQGQDTGACVFEKDFERTCEFTTRKDCAAVETVESLNSTNSSLVGITTTSEKKFYKDFLCSAEELGTSCAKQASTGCYNGKVYWYDSCGNRENVYSSNKDLSWNRGRVATDASIICPANDGGNPNCGNCDYFLGTRCAPWEGVLGVGKPADSNFFCKKTSCVNSVGDSKKNGENWCIFDSAVGQGNDPVGSRYFREVCDDGIVKVEPCADFRQEVCIEGKIENQDTNGAFLTSACRVNRWQDCVAQIDQKSCENIDRRDCLWLPPISGLIMGGAASGSGNTFSNPIVGDTKVFSNPTASSSTTSTTTTSPLTGKAIFGGSSSSDKNVSKTTTNRRDGVCVPYVPVGLKFWDSASSEGTCGLVSGKCVVTYETSKIGGKNCVSGCECIGENWALAMNKVCTAVGDCGGYVNYLGKYNDDGYEWKVKNKKQKFSSSGVGKIVALAKSGGSGAFKLTFGTTALGLGGLGLAGLALKAGGQGVGTSLFGSSILGLGKDVPVIGPLGETLKVNTNWMMRGAVNSLLVSGVVYLGASLFGASKQTRDALASSVGIGLFAGEAVGQLATKFGTHAFTSGSPLIQALGLKAPTTMASGVVPVESITKAGFTNFATDGLSATDKAGQLIKFGSPVDPASSVTAQVTGGTQLSWAAQNAMLINIGTTIAVAILIYYLTKVDVSTETVTYTCMPWQAPSGGNECEKCNSDRLPCSEYRCKSLGQNCQIVNAGTKQEKCVNVNPRDVAPPIIIPAEAPLTYGYKYTDVKLSPPGPGFRIIRDISKITDLSSGSGPCVKAFEPLRFGVDTDEPSQCKIDLNSTEKFDDMQFWFGGKNLYSYNHTDQFMLPSAKDINSSGIVLQNGKDMTMYIRCRDANGNANEAEYALKFCVDPTPDTTAPQIKLTSIDNGGCVVADTDSASVDFYVNEPSQCRWSKDDQKYENMQNNMVCNDQLYQVNALQLYTCRANLTGISRDETNFYVRCQDKAGAEESDRNSNAESYVFSLRGSTGMKMKDLLPNGTLFSSVSPAPVTLQVQTFFGCDNGKSICYYSTTGRDRDYTMFFDTNKDDGFSTQKQDLLAGRYTYYYKCVDSGGNVASGSTKFTLDIDTKAPVIARVYEEDKMLKVVTVRESECAYTFNNCDFTFAEGTPMPYANSTSHVAEWKKDKTFYIKCRDAYRNEEADCSMIVRPTDNFL